MNEKEYSFLIDFKSKKLNKVAAGFGIALGLMGLTYAFANKYTVTLRSPFQNPVIINERVIEVQYIEPVFEASQEAEIQETSEVPNYDDVFVITDRLLAHQKQQPRVYGKIYNKWGVEGRKWAELMSRESSLNPEAINPSSGSCGLPQALPCSKMKCDLSDVDCQLEWIEDYVAQRYGDIDTALAFHSEKGWY